MEFQIRQFDEQEWEQIEKTLAVKRRYLVENGLDSIPPIFEIGDEVGFFLGDGSQKHQIGVIVREDMAKVTIRCRDGKLHEVSPFLVFGIHRRR